MGRERKGNKYVMVERKECGRLELSEKEVKPRENHDSKLKLACKIRKSSLKEPKDVCIDNGMLNHVENKYLCQWP